VQRREGLGPVKRRDLLAGSVSVATCPPPLSAKAVGNNGGTWLLVYRWTVNTQEDPYGAPVYETREQFDGLRFATEEEAYQGAAVLRQTGVRLPTLSRFGRDSNVIPESITPMPHLLAVQLGIQPTH